jgi:organic radical activating enzyme
LGCLNSEGQFAKWFANIHLSGPCNRSCYFCIGQHMPAVDEMNTLDTWPLPGMDKFIEEVDSRKIRDIYLTGTNTEPFLFNHIPKLRELFRNYNLGIRSNGIVPENKWKLWNLFDKASVTICSFDENINRSMMGGPPPNIRRIVADNPSMDLKVNIVLGRANTEEEDVITTIHKCGQVGIRRINLREPYGQPHVGISPLCCVSQMDIILVCPFGTYMVLR